MESPWGAAIPAAHPSPVSVVRRRPATKCLAGRRRPDQPPAGGRERAPWASSASSLGSPLRPHEPARATRRATERERTGQHRTTRTGAGWPPDLDRAAPGGTRWTGEHGCRKTHNPSVASSPARLTRKHAGQRPCSERRPSSTRGCVPSVSRLGRWAVTRSSRLLEDLIRRGRRGARVSGACAPRDMRSRERSWLVVEATT